MKRKVNLLLLAIASMCVIPMPTEAQILDKAAKTLGGFLDAVDKATSKKSSKKEKNAKDKSKDEATVNATSQTKSKDLYLEAIYPGGSGYWLGWDEKTDLEVNLTIRREYAADEWSNGKKSWGNISVSIGDKEYEGELEAPSLVGDVYYYNIKSNSGTGRIGVKKTKSSEGAVELQIVDVSGSVANMIKKGQSCEWRSANGRGFDGTALCMTEEELEKYLDETSPEEFSQHIWWITHKYPNNPEKALKGLTFEAPKKFFRPKSDDVRMREKPNTKAAVVKNENNEPLLSYQWDIYPVRNENQGWYQTDMGWMSKSVTKTVTCNPITPAMMNTNQCGHVVDMDKHCVWRVYSPVGKSEMALCHQVGDMDNYLRLGKLVGNVFVFKYSLPLGYDVDLENPRKFELKREIIDGRLQITLSVGTNYCLKLTPGFDDGSGKKATPWALDFSKLNDKVLLNLFKDVIDKNETDFWYMTSELLTGNFANVFVF